MKTDIQYKKSSDELKAAWFSYKETKPTSTMSLVSFAAGFNAAIAMQCKKDTVMPNVELTGTASRCPR
jgi:hypothetical protein